MSGPVILPWRGVYPKIAADAFIAPTAVIIGDVVIGARSSIWFGTVLRGDVSAIRIGERSNIQDGSIVHVSSKNLPCLIGDDVLVGHAAILHACTVESGAFIGMRATVLDGAVVESGAMVAAGALVGPRKRVPFGEMWGGMPARLMRKLSDADLAQFKLGTDHYADLGDEYRAMIGA